MKTWLGKMSFDYISNITLAIAFFIYTYIKSPFLFTYFFTGICIFIVFVRLLYQRHIDYTNASAVKDNSFDKSFTDFIYNVPVLKR